MAAHLEWDASPEPDHYSFDDSERFEEDSLCSWLSEPESLCNNWRGWKRQGGAQVDPPASPRTKVCNASE